MPDNFLIIFIPLCVAGALVALYSLIKLVKNWKLIDGEEVKVRTVLVRWILFESGQGLTGAVKLTDVRIFFKMFSLSPVGIVQGKAPSVELQSISKIVRKKGFPIPYLRIHIKDSYLKYYIFANDSTLDKLSLYFQQHYIQVS